jgi:site-specific DNA recombinase
MVSLPHANGTSTLRDLVETVAIYARVSTEDQADRQTVEGQLQFLRRLAELHQWTVAGEYVDDGVSGTIPLDRRTDGRRLLEDAARGRFGTVLLYRLDRLGRKTRVLLDAHEALERSHVAIKSATEPFDTSTPIGTFVFQLLGSIAELEKATITERMTLGRDRVARQGKWTGGPIPFGFDLDAEARLVPSERLVDAVNKTEADIVREVFERIAAGSSAVLEAKRLQALGIPCARRWASGKELVCSGVWQADRVAHMIRNPAYKGCHVMQTKAGPVERPTVSLVSAEVWERANAQLTRNRLMATRNAKHQYLLRGLVRCGICGRGYVGTTGWIAKNVDGLWYRCNGAVSSREVIAGQRCPSKAVRADRLEDEVWADCREWIRNPGKPLAEAQRQLRERMEQSANLEAERRALHEQLAEKEAERERVLTLYRRNRITVDEAERQLDAITAETADVRHLLDALQSQAALTTAFEAHLTEATALLLRLRDQLEEVERTNDWATKRRVVECLVSRVVIQTHGDGPKRQATARITYAFPEAGSVVETDTGCRWRRTGAGR